MEKLFVNIRKAEPADIGGIASIYEQAVLLGTASFEVTPPSEEEMLSRMGQTGRISSGSTSINISSGS